MLRTIITTVLGFAAAAFIAAPIASADAADLSNVDVAQVDTQSVLPVWNGGKAGTFPYATGNNISSPFLVVVDENCDPVRGTWAEPGVTPGGFIEDPNGDSFVYSDGTTRRANGYKTGCNNC